MVYLAVLPRFSNLIDGRGIFFKCNFLMNKVKLINMFCLCVVQELSLLMQLKKEAQDNEH